MDQVRQVGRSKDYTSHSQVAYGTNQESSQNIVTIIDFKKVA